MGEQLCGGVQWLQGQHRLETNICCLQRREIITSGGKEGGGGGRGGGGGDLVIESPSNVLEVLIIQEMDAVFFHPYPKLGNTKGPDLRPGVTVAMDKHTGEDSAHDLLELPQLGLQLLQFPLQTLQLACPTL